MTKKKLAGVAAGVAMRHPQKTIDAGEFAARHWKGIWTTTKAVRGTSHAVRSRPGGVKDLGARAADPAVRAELKASVEALGAVVARARKVGLISATDDKKLNKELGQALAHASKAADRLRAKKQTHRLRWLFFASVLLAGYGEWMRRSASVTATTR